MTIRHILVPVDFSESTPLVMRFSGELAKKYSARITLCHVLHIAMTTVTDLPLDLERWASDSGPIAELRMWELAEPLGPEIKVEVAVDTGTPWDCIVRRAENGHHDHIVMGTHGRTGLKHILLGSVAERVLRHAPCSVTIVRDRPERGS